MRPPSEPADEPSPTASSANLDDARQLVFRAFAAARQPGRGDWNVMTTAVLKNRLLSLTGREFNQREYKTVSMLDFVRLFPDLLTVDVRSKPPLVTLLDATVAQQSVDDIGDSPQSQTRSRIRPDLWQAVMDYRSSGTYFWDEIDGQAKSGERASHQAVFPTTTLADMEALRDEFIRSITLGDGDEDLARRISDWRSIGFGSAYLPVGIRSQWTAKIRAHVLSRLHDFFRTNLIPEPSDLEITEFRHGRRPARTHSSDRDEIRDLRELLQKCIAIMSHDELSSIAISPAVILRAIRPGI